jgi:tight adherence protein C
MTLHFGPGALIGAGIALSLLPGVRKRLHVMLLNAVRLIRIRLAGSSSRRLGCDLRLCSVAIEDFVVWKLLGPVVGCAAVGMCSIVLAAVGMTLPIGWVVPMMMVVGLVGFQTPDLWVRARAKRLRMTFLFSFSSFLDLTNVLLSGGAGMETALVAASEAGDGVAFSRIREALMRARTTHRSPWQELQRMGELLGIEVVTEVGSSIQLAGEHGARVRGSLAKRAESVRHKLGAEVEASANAATERMGLPMVLLFLGFLVLIGYPAAQQMLQGL